MQAKVRRAFLLAFGLVLVLFPMISTSGKIPRLISFSDLAPGTVLCLRGVWGHAQYQILSKPFIPKNIDAELPRSSYAVKAKPAKIGSNRLYLDDIGVKKPGTKRYRSTTNRAYLGSC